MLIFGAKIENQNFFAVNYWRESSKYIGVVKLSHDKFRIMLTLDHKKNSLENGLKRCFLSFQVPLGKRLQWC